MLAASLGNCSKAGEQGRLFVPGHLTCACVFLVLDLCRTVTGVLPLVPLCCLPGCHQLVRMLDLHTAEGEAEDVAEDVATCVSHGLAMG